jgi:hypothetical protein
MHNHKWFSWVFSIFNKYKKQNKQTILNTVQSKTVWEKKKRPPKKASTTPFECSPPLNFAPENLQAKQLGNYQTKLLALLHRILAAKHMSVNVCEQQGVTYTDNNIGFSQNEVKTFQNNFICKDNHTKQNIEQKIYILMFYHH